MPSSDMSIIQPIPDENTSEAIMFGSQYMFAKSSKYFWDQTQDLMDREIGKLMASIIDPDFALFVVKHRPDMIYARQPPVNDPDKIRDLWTLRQIIAWGTGEELLDVYRTENRMWAMMHGISEYSAKLLEGGISERQWKAATLGFDLPIEYETIRTITDHDAIESRKEMDDLLDEESRMKAEQDRFRREYAMFLNGDLTQEPDDSPADRLSIYREEDITEEECVDEPDEVPSRIHSVGDDVARFLSESRDPISWLIEIGVECSQDNQMEDDPPSRIPALLRRLAHVR